MEERPPQYDLLLCEKDHKIDCQCGLLSIPVIRALGDSLL